MTNSLDAIAYTTIEYLQNNSRYPSRHFVYSHLQNNSSPYHWYNITPLTNPTNWINIHFYASHVIATYCTRNHGPKQIGTYHYADPDYPEALTQQLRNWLP